MISVFRFAYAQLLGVLFGLDGLAIFFRDDLDAITLSVAVIGTIVAIIFCVGVERRHRKLKRELNAQSQSR